MDAIRSVEGVLALSGPSIDALAAKYSTALAAANIIPSTSPPHITLFSKEELRTLPEHHTDILSSPSTIDVAHVIPLGCAHHSGRNVHFVVVVWNAGQLTRKRFGFRPKQFHITLSKLDDHTIDKGYYSLPNPPDVESYTIDELDHIIVSLAQYDPGDMGIAYEMALQACIRYPLSEKAFLRLAGISYRRGLFKQAMLSYAKVLTIEYSSEKLQSYCVRMLYKCSHHTEWGCVFEPDGWKDIEPTLRDTLVVPWPFSTIQSIAANGEDYIPTRRVESRTRLSAPSTKANLTELPRFFRWVVPFYFALMSTPRNGDDIALLSSDFIGIRHIVTLTEETPLPSQWFQGTPRPTTHTFMPIPNYHPPSIEQMDLILRLFEDENNLPILVHCGGGKGRAGAVAACYLAAYGFARAVKGQTQLKLSATDAIAALRSIRPGSIETQHQERFVHEWCSAVWKRNAILPQSVEEPPACEPIIVGDSNLGSVDLVFLVGLPGSGKSHFSRCLLRRTPPKSPWHHISQDDSGSRALCETAIGRSTNTKAIVDRCNPSPDDRRYWLSLASTWCRRPICVFFDYRPELCISRAQNRPDHPTLPPGGRVRAAVASMQGSLVAPSLEEGFKSIVTVQSFEAANSLVRRLSPPLGIFKFPRTPHLFNLGAATMDDIVTSLTLPSNPDAEDTTVVITEKIDGANMGISLDANHAFVVQNRSHYVTPNSHVQFSKLATWLRNPRISQALYAILGADPYFLERYILFGEWMSATHSVTYTKLPDYFIAFDLYDRSLDHWATRDVLERVVGARGIALVPIVESGTLRTVSLTRESLSAMVQRTSQYCDDRVEGVYVKLEKKGILANRGKVVRGDFIAGNEHWSKGIMEWNQVESSS